MNGQSRLPSVGRHTGAAGSIGVPSEARAQPLEVMTSFSIGLSILDLVQANVTLIADPLLGVLLASKLAGD